MDKLFKLKENGTTVRTEVLAGLTLRCSVKQGCQLKVFFWRQSLGLLLER